MINNIVKKILHNIILINENITKKENEYYPQLLRFFPRIASCVVELLSKTNHNLEPFLSLCGLFGKQQIHDFPWCRKSRLFLVGCPWCACDYLVCQPNQWMQQLCANHLKIWFVLDVRWMSRVHFSFLLTENLYL